jgi:hypothetical protein
MRPSDTAMTPQRIKLLRQIRDANANSNANPPSLYLDDLSAFARLKLVHFDREGNLSLTENAARILDS